MNNFTMPDAPRLLIQATLLPAQGARFQPTGFPDVGAGVYTLPNGREQLLVESAQSVANRLEAVCWDEASQELVKPLKGLTYVRVTAADGSLLTTSIQEAHRLNSVYIERSEFFETLKAAVAFDESRPMDRSKLIAALARYDVGCLLHGVFLESIAGTLRVARALSGFIEADGVTRVETGGVKNDRVRASKDSEGERTAAEGFGNVPFHRTEFVAETIVAYFNLDLEQLRGYRLGDAMERLLYALSVFKIQSFLERGLRLRTACDLVAAPPIVRAPAGLALPSLSETVAAMPGLIDAAASHFASPPVTTAAYLPEKKAKKGK
ncbi:MAG TPA: type I-U CRISPR-associated RAMP protein Csb1/Cas7u [Candidatus Binatia bacterium]|nr:type I-U CRISPR-associated RAMP protein Csb1/Cas7u [Candidatus Binatia bacterium]